MRKVVITYGLLAGAILAGMIFLMMAIVGDSSDFEKGESIGYISMVVAFSMIFFGIRSYRDKNLGGLITFNIAFRVAILITVIASACYVIGWMTYFNYVDNTFIERYTEFYTEKVNASGKTPAEIKTELDAFHENMTSYKNPLVMSLFTFLEVFPIGLVISILCAMLMRKSEVTTVTNEKK